MHSIRFEELEDRTLLAVCGTEYALICDTFSDYCLSETQSETNIIELVDATASTLKSAINEAETTIENDLIVIRLNDSTSIDFKGIDFKGEVLAIDIAYEEYGSLSLVGMTTTGEVIDISHIIDKSNYTVTAGTFFNGSIYLNVEDCVRSDEFEAANAASNQTVTVSEAVTGLDELRADERFCDIDGEGYSIVIIDTGINSDHDYFLDDDGNSRIIYQYDFVNGDSVAEDDDGHGTNVASIATGNGDYGGLASGANIIVLKVFDADGNGNFNAIEQALQWVAANADNYNIVSVNMSLGTSSIYTSIPSEQGLGIADEIETLAAREIIVTVAAGNEFYENNSLEGLSYPAILSGTLAVGAVYSENIGQVNYASGAIDYTTGTDRICSFSNRSSTLDMVMAAGAAITGAGINSATSLSTYTGTSQASPILAGTAALAQQIANKYLGRSLTVKEFNCLLTETADIIYDGDDENDNVKNTNTSYYRVNVYALAEAIYGMSTGDYVIGDQNDNEDKSPEETPEETIQLTAPIISVTSTGAQTAKLTIETVEGAIGYTLEIATSEDFQNAKSFSLSRSGTFTVNGLSINETYYFRAMANSNGTTAESSEWSETVSISNDEKTVTTTKLSVPLLVSVTAENESEVELIFNSTTNASSYILEYSIDSNFSTDTTVSITLSTAGNVSLSELTAGTTYYFRLKAVGQGIYTDSDWSRTLSVTTKEESIINPEEPDPPVVETPSLNVPEITNLSALGAGKGNLTFSTVENASGYLLQISTSSDFSTVQEITLKRSGSYTINGLSSGIVYYFRLMAISNDSEYNNSDWSETRSVSWQMNTGNDWFNQNRKNRFFR